LTLTSLFVLTAKYYACFKKTNRTVIQPWRGEIFKCSYSVIAEQRGTAVHSLGLSLLCSCSFTPRLGRQR